MYILIALRPSHPRYLYMHFRCYTFAEKQLVFTACFALYGAESIIFFRILLPHKMISCACDFVLLQFGMRGEGRKVRNDYITFLFYLFNRMLLSYVLSISIIYLTKVILLKKLLPTLLGESETRS